MIGKLLCMLGRHEVMTYRWAYQIELDCYCMRCGKRWTEGEQQ